VAIIRINAHRYNPIIVGIEVKVDKHDLLHDSKMQEYLDYVDCFYLVTPRTLAVEKLDYRAKHPQKDHIGDIIVEAGRVELHQLAEPLTPDARARQELSTELLMKDLWKEAGQKHSQADSFRKKLPIPREHDEDLTAFFRQFSDEELRQNIKLAKRELTRRNRPHQEGDQGEIIKIQVLTLRKQGVSKQAIMDYCHITKEEVNRIIAKHKEEATQAIVDQAETELTEMEVAGIISIEEEAGQKPAQPTPTAALSDILLAKLPKDGDLAIAALEKVIENDEILENLAQQISDYAPTEIRAEAQKLLKKLEIVKVVQPYFDQEVAPGQPETQPTEPTHAPIRTAAEVPESECDACPMASAEHPLTDGTSGDLLCIKDHDPLRFRVIQLKEEGLSVRKIATQLEQEGFTTSKSAVDRISRKAQEEGLL
jgi:transcriptional regulator